MTTCDVYFSPSILCQLDKLWDKEVLKKFNYTKRPNFRGSSFSCWVLIPNISSAKYDLVRKSQLNIPIKKKEFW